MNLSFLHPQLQAIFYTAQVDSFLAAVGAIPRIMLGARAEVHRVSWSAKVGVLFGSVVMGIACGYMARSFEQTVKMAPLLAMAGAFMAQDLVMVLMKRSKQASRTGDKVAEQYLKKFSPTTPPNPCQPPKSEP